MIDDTKFIQNLSMYDNSGLEFESIEDINEIIGENMRPFKKRGMYENEFTVVSMAGFEIVNEDSVLNLFNAIPPGPKELARHRTHNVFGRYSQAVLPVTVFHFKDDQYVLVQRRKPLTMDGKDTVELFRDYIPPINKHHDFELHFSTIFAEILKASQGSRIKHYGYCWENTGVFGTNISIYVCEIACKNHENPDEQIADLLKNPLLTEPKNIIGKRSLELLKISELREKYAQMINEPAKTKGLREFNDLLSVTGMFWLFRHLDKNAGINEDSVVE